MDKAFKRPSFLRLVLTFVLMAAMFGGATEGYRAWESGTPFDLTSAAVFGVIFSLPMTAWIGWYSFRQASGAASEGMRTALGPEARESWAGKRRPSSPQETDEDD